MNINTTGIIGLIIWFVLSAIFWAPMVKVTWKNFLHYIKDEDFDHRGANIFCDSVAKCDFIGVVGSTIALFVADIVIGFVFTVLFHDFPSMLWGVLIIGIVITTICFLPRFVRFLYRYKKNLSAVAKLAHSHGEGGEVKGGDIEDPKY